MVGTLSKTVAASATPEALSATAGLRVSWITIQAKSTNTGIVRLRAPLINSPVGYELMNPGDAVVLWPPASLHLAIDLTEIFIDVLVNGEGVNATFVK